MNKKKTFCVGLAALLVFGLVAAANSAQNREKNWGPGFRGLGMGPMENCGGMNKTALIEELGLPDNATHQEVAQALRLRQYSDLGLPENATREEIMEALWLKRLSDLNLTGDSTVRDFHNAVKARMMERRGQLTGGIGLDEDSTPGEVHQAMKENCGENPEDCPGRMGRGMGFGRGFKA